MRKAALLAAVMFAAAFPTTSNVAVAAADPAVAAQANTSKLMADAMNPYMATQPAAKPAKKKMAKKKKM